jgi:hypothetical protein
LQRTIQAVRDTEIRNIFGEVIVVTAEQFLLCDVHWQYGDFVILRLFDRRLFGAIASDFFRDSNAISR